MVAGNGTAKTNKTCIQVGGTFESKTFGQQKSNGPNSNQIPKHDWLVGKIIC